MKLTAITALLACSLLTTGVSAAPEKDESAARVSYTDDSQRDADPANPAWIELASPTPAKHGRVFITVDDDTGPVARLRIDAHEGRPLVRSVRIHYADGTDRVVRVKKALSAKNRSAYVELRGNRPIEHLVVITERNSRGSYTVHAAPPARGGNIATR